MEKYDFKYRIDLDYDYWQLLVKYLDQIEPAEEDYILFNEMKEKVLNPKKIKRSAKKMIAAEDATAARTKKAKEKINNAVNILRMEGKPVTAYRVSKVAGISYNTAKKYITINEVKE